MKKILAFCVMFMPFMASAATDFSTVDKSVVSLGGLLKSATTLILALAVVYFLWNVFKFVMAAGDEEKRKEGQQGIIYGLIGIAVMVSVWGLVAFLTGSTGIGAGTAGSAPTIVIPQ